MGLANLLPRSLKKSLMNRFRKEYINWQKELTKDFPTADLTEKHVANARVLADRNLMLDLMPKGGVVAEIGVAQGYFSEEILKRTQPSKLHLVDLWGSERYHDGLSKLVNDKFKTQIDAGQVEINRGYSTDWIPKFADQYFDWIYIDTDHSYKTTASELEFAQSKMKPGGIIAGHDYSRGSFNSMVRYGVVEAVHEFCLKYDWELIYITNETHRDLSFAIRKI